MDLRRHITAGRLSELVGADGVEADKVIRTLGWRRVAEEELPTLKPQTRQMLQAYADGVNTYLRGRSPREVAVEYSVLGLTLSDPPRSRSGRRSTASPGSRRWPGTCKGNYDDELARARLAGRLTTAQINQIYPPYDADAHPPILAGDEWSPQVPARATRRRCPSALTTAPATATPRMPRRAPADGRVTSPSAQAALADGPRGARRRPRSSSGAARAWAPTRGRSPARARPPASPCSPTTRTSASASPASGSRTACSCRTVSDGLPVRRQRLLLRGRARGRHRPQRRHRVGLHQPRPRRHRLLPRAGRRRHLPARRHLAADHQPRGGHQGGRRRRRSGSPCAPRSTGRCCPTSSTGSPTRGRARRPSRRATRPSRTPSRSPGPG